MSHRLTDITGIVVIDEVDVQCHVDLQYRVIPRLIALFPKVQFIMTSHSPLFLLGMERQFGQDGFQVIEMPNGTTITTERFSEFEQSLAYYRSTAAYEKELETTLASNEMPLVLLEGETDPVYVKTALALAGRDDILLTMEIDWVGIRGRQGAEQSGDKALDNVASILQANPGLSRRNVLLVYDCDTNKLPYDHGRVRKRAVPRNDQNTTARKGIENLLPSVLFEKRFYRRREIQGDYGEMRVIEDFDKVTFCHWVCGDRRKSNDFDGFDSVIKILEEWREEILDSR